MLRHQAFKFELMPITAQQRDMRRFAGSRRFVFNKALALQLEMRERGEKKHGYSALCKQLTAWRNSTETPWLADTPTHPMQQALKDLESGWARHFESLKKLKAGLIKPDQVLQPPTFKRKDQQDSFRFPDPKQFKLDQDNHRIFLPKLGWQRYRNSREVLGTLKNVTVSRTGNRWFVSIQTEREVEKPILQGDAVGIDMGIVRFATLSNGDPIEPLNSFKKHQQRLARYQRKMARRTKFSNNWKKAKAKVTQTHTDIANARRDFLHKTSTTISKNHAIVCIEDLQVRNMSKSAAGNSEKPGKNVSAKSGLNKSILDQGWAEFRRQLDYKLDWLGGCLIAVPPRNTSRTCPSCLHVSADNRKTQAWFLCVECGYENNADVVGAINVLRAGYARLACQANDATKSSATGTHRSDSGAAQRRC